MERYTVFDLEMPNRSGDRISAIGICVIEDGEITEQYYSLVDPECKFDRYTIKITGITPALVKGEPKFPEIWEEISELFEDTVLVAHSVQGDMHVLSRCLSSYGILWKPTVKCACTLELGNLCYPDFVSHRLDAMCEALGIELQHHNAGSDAEGAARLLLNYMENGFDPMDHLLIFDTVRARAAHKPKKPFPQRVNEEIREELAEMTDEESRLIKLSEMPEIPEEEIVGVPVPVIGQIAERLLHTNKATEFMRILPHASVEEYDLHACFINEKKKFSSVFELTKALLPYVNNPETCDLLSPKAFRRGQPELLPQITEWLDSFRPYTVRFAIGLLQRNYLDAAFDPEFLAKICPLAEVFPETDEIIPVFFAEALVKQYEYTLPYLTERLLPEELHNKTVVCFLQHEKAPAEKKAEVKALYIK